MTPVVLFRSYIRKTKQQGEFILPLDLVRGPSSERSRTNVREESDEQELSKDLYCSLISMARKESGLCVYRLGPKVS